jgi:hypothetical protein
MTVVARLRLVMAAALLRCARTAAADEASACSSLAAFAGGERAHAAPSGRTAAPQRRVRPLAPWALLAAALVLPSAAAPAQELVWQPLTTIYTPMREMLEMRVGTYDPARVFVAFVELDEHPTAEPRLEALVLSTRFGRCCSFTVLSPYASGHYDVLGGAAGTSIALGPGWRRGKRDILIDGESYRFDGWEYQYNGAIDAWYEWDELDAATRTWIERTLDPDDDPEQLYVAFADLDAPDSTAGTGLDREVIVHNTNGSWCGSAGCSFDIYTYRSGRYVPIWRVTAHVFDLGPGYTNGWRDLFVDRRMTVQFDGTDYRGHVVAPWP